MPIKIYLSQANQAHNPGPGGYTEKAGMDALTRAIAEVFALDDRFVVKRNVAGNRVDTAYENTQEANTWGADWYVAFHSNASGVKGHPAKGTVGFYHSKSPRGKRLCEAIVKAIGPLSPGADHGCSAHDGFIEIHRPHAPAALIEVEGHDWKEGVDWIEDKRPKIARAAYEGICRGVGVKPLTTGLMLDYRPLKRQAVRIAKALGIDASAVDAAVRGKGAAFEKLLRAIADHTD